jgi:hypothetical protein
VKNGPLVRQKHIKKKKNVFFFQAPNGTFFWRLKCIYSAQGGRTEKIKTVLESPGYNESDYVFKTFL